MCVTTMLLLIIIFYTIICVDMLHRHEWLSRKCESLSIMLWLCALCSCTLFFVSVDNFTSFVVVITITFIIITTIIFSFVIYNIFIYIIIAQYYISFLIELCTYKFTALLSKITLFVLLQ